MDIGHDTILQNSHFNDMDVPAIQNRKELVDNNKNSCSIWAQNVSASYNGGPLVLSKVNLRLPSAEVIVIVGPNGAGKSTLFNILIGLKKPSSGELLIFGKTVEHQCSHQNIAYVPQHEQIDWDYPICVWEVVLGGRYGHMKKQPGLRRFFPPHLTGREHVLFAERALHSVDMWQYRQHPIGSLSGGQKKRVFIARALAQDSSLMLLDEPLVGVDDRSEKLIFEALDKARNGGKTIIMITHDFTAAQLHANYVVLIDGTVLASGLPQELLKDDDVLRDERDLAKTQARFSRKDMAQNEGIKSLNARGYQYVD